MRSGKYAFLSMLLLLSLLLSACGQTGQIEPPLASDDEGELPPAEEVYAGPTNPLTGLPVSEDYENARPVAIMVNNLKGALPQLGVSEADIIYEVLAEGGITRMLAVYQDPSNVGSIGSVRSSRPYYLELALGLDAVYLHAGGSPDAYNKIKEWNVTALDCVRGGYEGTLYWRDSERRKNLGYEHSVITSGETIAECFAGYSFRKEHEADYKYEMTFVEDGTPAQGESAQSVTVPFSSYKTGLFTYDEESGRYLIEEYGKPYVDGNSGAQVSCTNLLILETRCAQIAGDDAGRISVDLNGGAGWYACGGKYVPISWEKDAPYGQLRYFTSDGQPLALQQGNSYVCIVPLKSGTIFT